MTTKTTLPCHIVAICLLLSHAPESARAAIRSFDVELLGREVRAIIDRWMGARLEKARLQEALSVLLGCKFSGASEFLAMSDREIGTMTVEAVEKVLLSSKSDPNGLKTRLSPVKAVANNLLRYAPE